MKREDELGARIARLLDESTGDLPAESEARLAAARRQALARHAAAKGLVHAPVHAWAGAFSRFTEHSLLGVRYVVPLAALVLGLMGVVYVHTGTMSTEVADIDMGLLTDELPINAYLAQDFDSWLKRSSR